MSDGSELRKRSGGAADALTVVGIGASAGGLAALELFFKAVPADSHMAFVVVQHLAPSRKDLLVGLLQNITKLHVLQVVDGQRLQAGHIHVIPPGRMLLLEGETLVLKPLERSRAVRTVIDEFFKSLASALGDRAIAVVLSGLGADGTEGLRSIREHGGWTLAQTPGTAQSGSMPESAVAAEVVSVVAPAEELPGRIEKLAGTRPPAPAVQTATPLLGSDDLPWISKILDQLRKQTGQDFSLYKTGTVSRRLERRMALHGLLKASDYLDYLQANPQEASLLFNELLIGVTAFFRDGAVWEAVRTAGLPHLLALHPDGGKLRFWVAGCSTGEEAYSLAMVFSEVVADLQPKVKYDLQIFATDLDSDAISRARTGYYRDAQMGGVTPERVQRFFNREDGGFRIRKELRSLVIFAVHNAAMDPPFTKLDLVSCRNVLIYLEMELQRRILPLFHYCLNPDALLLLGTAETAGSPGDLFAPLVPKARLYRRADRSRRAEFPAPLRRTDSIRVAPPSLDLPVKSPVFNPHTITQSLLLQRFAPVAALTDEQGEILYLHGRTGRFLEPAAGKANMNLFAMAREGTGEALAEGYRNVLKSQEEVTLSGLCFGEIAGVKVLADVTLQVVKEPGDVRRWVIAVFVPLVASAHASPSDSTPPRQDQAFASAELKRCREELQAAREEMQSSQEELRSANEELQSTNEELQSINEELTTSKEELQSMNEELQTVNQELQSKVDELSLASDDMKNLLNSTDIATLFLDDSLKVRRFTTQMTGIVKLIPSDAGRPITDIVSLLDYPDLESDASEVLRSLVFRERQVPASDGRWFRVRIMPYRANGNRINGVVITFMDETSLKRLESMLREVAQTLADPTPDRSNPAQLTQRIQSLLAPGGKAHPAPPGNPSPR